MVYWSVMNEKRVDPRSAMLEQWQRKESQRVKKEGCVCGYWYCAVRKKSTNFLRSHTKVVRSQILSSEVLLIVSVGKSPE